jgi:hypothetical protein
LNIESAVRWDFEACARCMTMPLVRAVELHCKRTADHSHPFCGGRAEMIFAGRNHSDRRFQTVAFESNALHSAIEVRVVFQHVCSLSFVAKKLDERFRVEVRMMPEQRAM